MMEQPQPVSVQPVSVQAEFSPENHYYPNNSTTYSQNASGINSDGQNLNAVPVYQQNYATPQQMYPPQDMNHNIPNYSQDMQIDPFKPQYEYDTTSQGHQQLVYNNTDSGLGYESSGMVYNGDVSMNYYSDSSNGQFRQAGTHEQAGTQPVPPVKRGPGRPTKKILSPGSSDKSYVCETCFKPLGTFQSLKKHMVTHTGLRQYRCDICGNSYTQKHNLTKHLRVHSGERPYLCSYCPASYRTSHLLKNHMNKHPEYHSPSVTESEDKSNDSELMESGEDTNDSASEMGFLNYQDYQKTKTVEEMETTAEKSKTDSVARSENQSDKLANKLKDQSETNEHEPVKKSEKEDKKMEAQSSSPVKQKLDCNQCDQTFESRVKLLKHMNEHNSQKTLCCPFCNASFRWKASLDIHMRKHKGQKLPSYQLKGLKIKNGNRIALKIVNTEKTPSDSKSNPVEKKPAVRSTDKKEEKTEKVEMLKNSDSKNKELKKPDKNRDISLDIKRAAAKVSIPLVNHHDTRQRTVAAPADVQPVNHHDTRLRSVEARETKRNSDFVTTKPTKSRKFECASCGQLFTQNFSLKRHISNKICTR